LYSLNKLNGRIFSFNKTGVVQNGVKMSSSQSGTPNKRAPAETPSVSSVNSSFSSTNRADNNNKPTIGDNGDFHNLSSNSGGQKSAKDLDTEEHHQLQQQHHHHHHHHHHDDIDEDDDEEIITGHGTGAASGSAQGSTATSESNSPHRVNNNLNNSDLNSSGDDDDEDEDNDDNDNSDDKILTL
jgi:hypothetical protein